MAFILIIFVLAFILFFSLIGLVINSISYVVNSIIDSFCKIFSIKRKRGKKQHMPFFTFHTNYNGTRYNSKEYYSQQNRQNKYQTSQGYADNAEPKKIFAKNEGEYISFEEL